jgi:hypothetical protein
MTTRRTFIHFMAGAVPVALAAPDFAETRVPRAVIVDDAHDSARVLAARAGMRGTPVLATHQGDVTTLWLKHLRPLWTSSQDPVAGLTLPGTLFCLEQLAWQHAMRVIFHAEHLLLPERGLEHTVHRDQRSHRLTAAALERAGGRWPQHLADTLVANRLVRAARPGPSLAALAPPLPAGATLLTSWIIA